jgi:hypothetical protein
MQHAKESVVCSLPDHTPEQPDQHEGTLTQGGRSGVAGWHPDPAARGQSGVPSYA